ncbi:hypothetical protein ACJJTC_003004 [Scirpophaga incertulas]
MMYLVLLLAAVAAAAQQELPPSCRSRVYCDSELLHRVQLARLYSDSKRFVDLHMRYSEEQILADFQKLLDETNNPTKQQLQTFVDEHFNTLSELEDWTPPDHSPDPAFLKKIKDEKLKEFAKNIHNIWPTLGRKVKDVVFEDPTRFSLIPVTNGFIIPGGRFREIYYWDSYWIIKGLLISGMKETARGMIENLLQLLDKCGIIPNGSRWYYQERSQPPLITAMMKIYIEETGDLDFLEGHMDQLEEELKQWLITHTVDVQKGDKKYSLLRYNAPTKGPRPESYYEDYTNAQSFESQERQQEFYTDIKSAAESGWDFSTRWFVGDDGNNDGNLTTIHTRDIVPVDLNAMFADALQNMANFKALMARRKHSRDLLNEPWSELARDWREAIEKVLWDDKDGTWYDFDLVHNSHRRNFYPSNASPLWGDAVEKHMVKLRAKRVFDYLKKSKALQFDGGIPASLIRSGEQWDFPNAWPPLVSILLKALETVGSAEAKSKAFDVAETWVRACYKGYTNSKQMFEKYDAETAGKYGDGGEYVVQSGFGWTNGVVLEFIDKYGEKMTAEE